jgi:pimeloyl-ACP methyl ester carboxylesterase
MGGTDPAELARRFLAGAREPTDLALAVLNGAIGDRLAEAGSSLAIPMALYGTSERVALGDPPRPPARACARACVLVHGLMGNEHAWGFGSDRGRVEYGRALADARDVTPIYVRYNSGLHISTNGRELANRLATLFDAWPELDEITIVAHSMGGLVTRSACHYAKTAGHAWVERLRRVFLLGVPVHGAPWEQLAHVAAFTLESIWNPWTKLVGRTINMRSAGIKDLRHGFVLDEDWHRRDPDELRLAVPRRPAALPHVRWYVAAGVLGKERSMLARLFGDGNVHTGSARGRGFGSPEGLLPDAEVRVFEHTSHMALMNDPAVLEQILAWWA